MSKPPRPPASRYWKSIPDCIGDSAYSAPSERGGEGRPATTPAEPSPLRAPTACLPRTSPRPPRGPALSTAHGTFTLAESHLTPSALVPPNIYLLSRCTRAGASRQWGVNSGDMSRRVRGFRAPAARDADTGPAVTAAKRRRSRRRSGLARRSRIFGSCERFGGGRAPPLPLPKGAPRLPSLPPFGRRVLASARRKGFSSRRRDRFASPGHTATTMSFRARLLWILAVAVAAACGSFSGTSQTGSVLDAGASSPSSSSGGSSASSSGTASSASSSGGTAGASSARGRPRRRAWPCPGRWTCRSSASGVLRYR